MKSKEVILMMGGNEENTFSLLEKALIFIEKEIGKVISVSGIYETAAWGPIPQANFLNMAVRVHSQLPPVYLLKKLLSIETKLGRKRQLKYGPRSIDIDMLLYGQRIIKHKDLIVPHPEMQNRKFVLMPCDEIVSAFRHPVIGVTIHQLLADCKDKLEVKKWKK